MANPNAPAARAIIYASGLSDPEQERLIAIVSSSITATDTIACLLQDRRLDGALRAIIAAFNPTSTSTTTSTSTSNTDMIAWCASWISKHAHYYWSSFFERKGVTFQRLEVFFCIFFSSILLFY